MAQPHPDYLFGPPRDLEFVPTDELEAELLSRGICGFCVLFSKPKVNNGPLFSMRGQFKLMDKMLENHDGDELSTQIALTQKFEQLLVSTMEERDGS